MRKEIIRLDWISKSFGDNDVLRLVNVCFYAGEIHALMGANAAGKSTLLGIISGLFQPDHGSYYYDDRPCHFSSPSQAESSGIFRIDKDPKIIPQFDCADNAMVMLREHTGKLLYSKRKNSLQVQEMIFHLELDDLLHPGQPGYMMNTLSRLALHILCALANGAKVLVFDEPFSALSTLDADRLKIILQKVSRSNVTVIFASHNIAAVSDLADRVTILRNSCCTVALENPHDVVRLNSVVLGHTVGKNLEMADRPKPLRPPSKKEVFRADGLVVPELHAPLSFSVCQGEVLGIASFGLLRTSVCERIFGLTGDAGGKISLNGTPVSLDSPKKAIQAGLGYLGPDHKTDEIFSNLSVTENMTLPFLRMLFPRFIISPQAERKITKRYSDFLLTGEQEMEDPALNLSLGMKKRLAIARWFCIPRRLILLSDPSRSLDFDGVERLKDMVIRQAQEGTAFIVESSNLDDIINFCDRVLIFYNGSFFGVLSASEITRQNILSLVVKRSAYGGSEQHEPD